MKKNDNFKQKHVLGCFSVEFGKYKKMKIKKKTKKLIKLKKRNKK